MNFLTVDESVVNWCKHYSDRIDFAEDVIFRRRSKRLRKSIEILYDYYWISVIVCVNSFPLADLPKPKKNRNPPKYVSKFTHKILQSQTDVEKKLIVAGIDQYLAHFISSFVRIESDMNIRRLPGTRWDSRANCQYLDYVREDPDDKTWQLFPLELDSPPIFASEQTSGS